MHTCGGIAQKCHGDTSLAFAHRWTRLQFTDGKRANRFVPQSHDERLQHSMEAPENRNCQNIRRYFAKDLSRKRKYSECRSSPKCQGALVPVAFYDVCTLCIVAFILCREEKKQQNNNSVNSPSAPTASISSHFHSQSVLNVSHPLSLFACLHSVRPHTQMHLPLRQLALFANSEIRPRLRALPSTGGDAVGVDDAVMSFSPSIDACHQVMGIIIGNDGDRAATNGNAVVLSVRSAARLLGLWCPNTA